MGHRICLHRLSHTRHASVRYDVNAILATPHTTEARVKKHLFLEPSRIPSIPEFTFSRKKAPEHRPATSRLMSGLTIIQPFTGMPLPLTRYMLAVLLHDFAQPFVYVYNKS
jgi:hypothetical protein